MFYRYDYTLAIKHLLEAQQLAPQPDATILLNLGMAANFYAQCFPTQENISNSRTFLTASLRKAIQQDKLTIAYSAFANLWTFGFTPFTLSTASEAMELFTKIKPHREAMSGYTPLARGMPPNVCRKAVRKRPLAGCAASCSVSTPKIHSATVATPIASLPRCLPPPTPRLVPSLPTPRRCKAWPCATA